MNGNGSGMKPTTLLCLLLGGWWIVNLIQAGCTELANDEAYYHMFSRELAWGYFDHPPMTALLVRMGAFLGGELGVRFFFTILQPLYLLILYRIIRPEQPTRRDVLLYFVICAALPVLQLYGFIAVPDAPLLLFSALFLLCYKRFTERDSLPNALWLGLSVAALAYSKYHGALVVFFTLVSNPRIFRQPRLYLAGGVALLLLVPHLIWQYEHDFASIRYHLAGRNGFFRFNYITEYLLNIFAIFNPLFFPLYVKSWIKSKSANPTERAIYCITLGLIVFFLLSSIRGYVQPQWVIVSSFGFILLLFGYARRHPRTRKYTMISGCVTIGLIVLVRLVMIFNPIGLRFEVFDNKTSYGAIAAVAQGRPVIFGGSYAIAAKYGFYTGQPAFSQPSINYRTSQWQYMDTDTRAAGGPVLIETGPEGADSTLHLANGRDFSYVAVADFRPVRKVEIAGRPLPRRVKVGETLTVPLTIFNPYDYDIGLSPESNPLVLAWGRNKEVFREYVLPVKGTVPAGSLLRQTVRFTVPEELASPREYRVGFTIRPRYQGYWFNSKESKVCVE